MKKKILFTALFIIFISYSFHGVDRFPRPEFETNYIIPETQTPPARSVFFDIIDVVLLAGLLSAASYIVIKKKNRLFLIVIMAASVLYFGFFKKGCICPVGSVQNLALFIVSSDYAFSIFTLLFFLLPVIFTVFFGRTFCSSVCPFGAVQELVLIKPLRVPSHVDRVLRMMPFLYLFITVMFAVSGAGFLICTFDPFVSFFRLSGDLWKVVYSVAFILLSMFIARPYCRYLCPYGLILSFASIVSRKHINLTSKNCISCGICDAVCPVNSIENPINYENTNYKSGIKKLAIMIPFMLVIASLSGYHLGNIVSGFHPTVKLARQIAFEEQGAVKEKTVDSEAYRDRESDLSKIFTESIAITKNYRVGTAVIFFLMTAIVLFLLWYSSRSRKKEDYSINKFTCVSCMKCTELCPKEKS